MSTAVLSIGTNIGDPSVHLQIAVQAVRPWLLAMSSVYTSPPWGPVVQDDFCNAVLVVDDPAAGAFDWLERAQAAELRAGRQRHTPWGPRTLDIDVIDVDACSSAEPQLTLPHPRAHLRAFVLVPWLEVDPHARLGDRAVGEWLAELPAAEVDAVVPDTRVRLR